MAMTDEKRIKRASHAGRNLACLACLASIMAVVLLGVGFFANPFMLVPAVGVVLIAAAYWTLGVAAKRGEAKAVGIVIAVLTLHLAFNLILHAVISAAQEAKGVKVGVTEGDSGLIGLVVLGLIIALLANNWNELRKLKERGLWEKTFGSAKPTKNLLIVGGIMLVTGFAGTNGGLFFAATQAGAARAAELQKARVFLDIIGNEEEEFLTTLKSPPTSNDPAASVAYLQKTKQKLDALEQRVQTAREAAADNKSLSHVLTLYANAVAEWQKGVNAAVAGETDAAKIQALFDSGDAFRTSAGNEFNKKYGPKGAGPRR